MSNLSDIGFPVKSEQDVNEVIFSVLNRALPIDCPRGKYLRFSDESGAEIYLQGNLQDELIGFNPHFAGKSRRLVGLINAVERDSSELDGGFYAWAEPSDAHAPEMSGKYPFVFDVPDFRLNDNLAFPQTLEIQLSAFASNDFQIFSHEEDFRQSRGGEPQFATKSFVPSGLFSPNDESSPIVPPRPHGILSGEIKEFELRTNSLTNQKFYWFLVETYGGEVDIVADPKLIGQEPKIGGIISGQFWLSGKLIKQ